MLLLSSFAQLGCRMPPRGRDGDSGQGGCPPRRIFLSVLRAPSRGMLHSQGTPSPGLPTEGHHTEAGHQLPLSENSEPQAGVGTKGGYMDLRQLQMSKIPMHQLRVPYHR